MGRAGIGCSPCYNSRATAECPYGNTACMHHLTVDRMYQAVRRVLHEQNLLPQAAPEAALAATAR